MRTPNMRKHILRVRATCEQSAEDFCKKERKFFEAKSVDTFNANRSRQSPNLHHLKQAEATKQAPSGAFLVFSGELSSVECQGF